MSTLQPPTRTPTSLVNVLAGLLFGAGIVVSGLTNPLHVLAGLDVAAIATARYDATVLAAVAGAVAVAALASLWRRPSAGSQPVAPAPSAQTIDARLLTGSALFGIGLGLVGLGPAAALVAATLAAADVLPATIVFFSAMLTGIWLTIVARRVWPLHAGDPQS